MQVAHNCDMYDDAGVDGIDDARANQGDDLAEDTET